MPIHQIQQRTLLDCARESRHCFETVWSQLGRPAERARSRSKSPLDVEEEEGDLQLGVKEQVLLEKARQARRALLYSFAVNVIIPLLIASCIDQFDFPTMSMIVFTAVNDKGKRVDAESKAWKGVVSQYFEVLDMNNQ
ncbi:hypothetical protein ADEAN_000143800 [Angomonas deanei]|uniref:Uncharacterized protein n=1 Tax=Angomonas deanei TaxID=59799 RepID=A0A7G2C458_9TRYP|nr:hypothetical protein ADEAN_000143800 [Angomonas deanei]